MLKVIDIDKEQLRKMTFRTFEGESMESTAHLFIDNGEKKVFKLFKNGIDIENKVNKIILLKDRLKNVENVVTADQIVTYDNKVIGYTMPYVNGVKFTSLLFDRKKNIEILKEISKTLKELHKLGIICGDIHNNILVDKNGTPYFIDHDNFAIDNLDIDTKNLNLQKYERKTGTIDYKFDNYELNLYTLSILTKITNTQLRTQYISNPKSFNFKDKEIKEIVNNTFFL